MIDIYSQKERDIKKIIEISKLHKIFFHENLEIKKISEDNYGVFATSEIFKNEKYNLSKSLDVDDIILTLT